MICHSGLDLSPELQTSFQPPNRLPHLTINQGQPNLIIFYPLSTTLSTKKNFTPRLIILHQWRVPIPIQLALSATRTCDSSCALSGFSPLTTHTPTWLPSHVYSTSFHFLKPFTSSPTLQPLSGHNWPFSLFQTIFHNCCHIHSSNASFHHVTPYLKVLLWLLCAQDEIQTPQSDTHELPAAYLPSFFLCQWLIWTLLVLLNLSRLMNVPYPCAL